MAGSDNDARQQASQDAMADDQFRNGGVRQHDGVMRRRRQRQQHRVRAKRRVHRCYARAGHNKPRGSATKQSANIAKATCTRHKNRFTQLPAGFRARLDHAAHGFVTRHQRVTHAGKGWHAPGPEQAFCSGANAAPVNVHDNILHAWRRQFQSRQRELFWCAEQDSECFHSWTPRSIL